MIKDFLVIDELLSALEKTGMDVTFENVEEKAKEAGYTRISYRGTWWLLEEKLNSYVAEVEEYYEDMADDNNVLWQEDMVACNYLEGTDEWVVHAGNYIIEDGLIEDLAMALEQAIDDRINHSKWIYQY